MGKQSVITILLIESNESINEMVKSVMGIRTLKAHNPSILAIFLK